MTSAATRPARTTTVPHIVTELPGPKARAHIAFDEAWTSPSLPRAYPIVPVRGEGPDGRGHRRQPVPRLRGRDRGQLDRPLASGRRGAHPAPGRGAHPFQRLGLLPADLSRGLPRARPDRPDRGPGTGVSRQQRDGGRRGGHQARPVRHEAPVHRRVPRRVPRPDLRLRVADRLEGEVPRRLRAAPAGRLSRAVRQGRRSALVRRGAVRQARPGQRGRGDHRRADPGRGRLHRPGGRLPPGACGRSATATASCSSPTRSSRAPGGPARCGPSTTGASSRTSS